MILEDISETIRVKLTEESERRFWDEINCRGGIREFARNSGFKEQDLYNIKNRDLYFPIKLVCEVLQDFEIVSLKGQSNSKPIKNPCLPLDFSDELLTRVSYSVFLNKEEVPVYRTKEKELAERFLQLLNEIGDVPLSVYNRKGYEIRYPKYLHEMMQLSEFEESFSAAFDEEGSFEGNLMVLSGKSKDIGDFKGELYSREKRYQLYLKKEDSDKLEKLIKDETEKTYAIRRKFDT